MTKQQLKKQNIKKLQMDWRVQQERLAVQRAAEAAKVVEEVVEAPKDNQ